MDDASGSLAPPSVRERYRDLEPIGAGGLGEVYRAHAVDGGGRVAIKVLRAVPDPSVMWHRIRRELTALASLSGHPHVVQLVDLVDVDGAVGIVMEFAPYGSVARFVNDPGGAPPAGRRATLPEIVLVARHAAAALVVAHEQSIIHRDVKPHNLLIGSDGRVMLCDFGVSALGRTSDFRTPTNAHSLRYSSPEELDDVADVTAATDVYSLGATLLHLAHGSPPTLRERLAPWTPPPESHAPSGVLDSLIASCLRPDASERPPAAEVLDRLERLDWTLDDRVVAFDVAAWSPIEPVAAAGVVPPVELDTRQRSLEPTLGGERRRPPARPEPDRRRRWPLVAGAAACCVAATSAAGWWLVRDRSSSPEAAVGVPGPEHASGGGAVPDVVLTVVERPEGLADIRTEVTWPFDRLGECLVQQPGVDRLVGLDCRRPHDLQRIAIAELDADRFGPGAGFDAAAIDQEVGETCSRSLEAFVGVPAETSIFEVAHTRPGELGWESGDRAFQCLIGIHGRRTVGDAVGSRR